MIFKDSTGCEWDSDLNVAVAMRLRKEGINFYALEENKGEGLRALFADDYAVVELLWKIVRSDAEAKGVSEEEFYKRLKGVSLADAVRAFKVSYANFTRNPAIHSTIHEGLEMERRAEAATAKATLKMAELARAKFAEHEANLSDENISKLFADELKKHPNLSLKESPSLPATT